MTDEVRLRADRVVGSMLWSAWADALGFISELTDGAGLRRRLDGRDLVEPVAWIRRVGGQYGVSAALPAGCYSDDTQLRLAAARAISPRGFDVEAFAAVELTVWPAYALGGGKASKAAASNFAKPNTPWYANFFEGWTEAGGNGAAMRIQPHVWAAKHGELADTLRAVLTDAITTHGHPRAVVGAVLYAAALFEVFNGGRLPTPRTWPELLDLTRETVKLLHDLEPLPYTWLPKWEDTTGQPFEQAWYDTVDEARVQLQIASKAAKELLKAVPSQRQATYGQLIDDLRLSVPKNRGSGISTVVAALTLAASYPDDPAGCALLASRALGTDTDTIATMAAAIVGGIALDVPHPKPLQDADYLTAQALRLADIACGKPAESFSYPDLLEWTPPRSQLDATGFAEGRAALAGLGYLTPLPDSEIYSTRGSQWQWMQSDFGATFLLKHRAEPRELPASARPVRRVHDNLVMPDSVQEEGVHQEQLFPDDTPALLTHRRSHRGRVDEQQRRQARPSTEVNVDQMLAWVQHKGFTDEAIGYAVRRVVELGSLEQLVAFTTALRAAARRFGEEL